MNIAQIEEQVQQVIKNFSPESFIYDLLAAYDKPKNSIIRLQKGNLNLSKIPGEIVWKRNLLFRSVENEDPHLAIDHLRKSAQVTKHNLRFVVVTDYKTLLAVDTKTAETLDIPIEGLPKRFDFFLPWAGQEKHRVHNESAADVKAAYRMARLYDEICKDNPGMDAAGRHSLNVFLSRLLFCFFAEDTEIFPDGIFTQSIASHTQEDGSDLQSYLDKLFEVMNTEDRVTYPAYLQAFPYVNGGLFADKHAAPKFFRQSRKIIIECGELDWSEINPDIFGSMIQSVVHPDQRSNMGMHYTSITNIMKVIEPLFLNELRAVFQDHQDSAKGLKQLLERLYNIRILDPACGSGNFLIVAYKELRKLEMQIYQRLQEIDNDPKVMLFRLLPKIRLTQFFGIELDDFAHEIAVLSLWLAEHQMNLKFKDTFGQVVPSLPLKQSGKIVCDNATRLDWETVCPKDKKSEIYILGNPPYLGARNQSKQQKEDVRHVFKNISGLNSLDYIACWFLKAAKYISGGYGECGFVSTNSICQGEQVCLLWPNMFAKGIEIGFAHQSFKWTNNAKKNAGVTCVVVGIRPVSNKAKNIYTGKLSKEAKNISPYLTDNHNVIIHKRSKPIISIPSVVFGNQAIEGGNLILNTDEKNNITSEYPNAEKFIRRLYGAEDYIKGLTRWCIWVSKENLYEASMIPAFKDRFKKVAGFRKNGGEVARSLIHIPYRFRYVHESKNSLLILPRTTSEKREYLTIGFLEGNAIVTDAVQVIYDPEPYIMGILSSKMHNVWVRAVAGRLEERIRYSLVLCYNTFPLRELSSKQKDTLANHVFNVIAEREKYPEKTIAQLYDPDKMPAGLLQAHRDMDAAVERCYRSKPFTSDEERLEYLFQLYEEVTKDVQKEIIHA